MTGVCLRSWRGSGKNARTHLRGGDETSTDCKSQDGPFITDAVHGADSWAAHAKGIVFSLCFFICQCCFIFSETLALPQNFCCS